MFAMLASKFPVPVEMEKYRVAQRNAKNLKLTMRFRHAFKFLLHTQYARGFVTLKRLIRL
jgi:hypothetical protein